MVVTIIGANSFIARNMIYVYKTQYPDVKLNLYDIQDVHIDGENNYHSVKVTDIESCYKIDFDADIVYIFSGKTGTLKGFDEYEAFIDVNEKGLINILSTYVKKNSVAKLVFPSTRLVYKGSKLPLVESAEKEFKTIYAINKFACEQYLKMYHNLYNVSYAIFRICVPYGTLVPQATSYGTAEFMLKKAKAKENILLYGRGELRRTLTHMDDLCNALISGAHCHDCANDVFNIGGENYSLDEMAQAIAAKYGVEVEYVPWPDDALRIESGDTVFDSNKFDNLTQFKYKYKFLDVLKGETI